MQVAYSSTVQEVLDWLTKENVSDTGRKVSLLKGY